MGLSEALQRYLKYLKLRNYTRTTRDDSRARVLRFFEYLVEQGIADVREVRPFDIVGYLKAMKGGHAPFLKQLASSSIATYASTLRRFFRFLEDQEVIFKDPSFHLGPHRSERVPKPVLSEAEMELLLAAPDLSTACGLRDRAILELLYETGIRRGEVHRLNLEDLDLHEGVLWIRCGKGGKDRVVPMGSVALAWMRTYLTEARPKLLKKPSERALFVSSIYGMRLPLEEYSHLVGQYARSSGLKKPVACHVLRRTCATHLLSGGADIRYVQELLGHQSCSTTQVYLHFTLKQLKESHKKFHPRERKKIDRTH